MIAHERVPGSLSDEVQQFLNAVAANSSDDLRTFAPRLDRRLREQDRERSAIVTALNEIPLASRPLAATLLCRIRALRKAEDQTVFDCYWHDLGGEGGA